MIDQGTGLFIYFHICLFDRGQGQWSLINRKKELYMRVSREGYFTPVVPGQMLKWQDAIQSSFHSPSFSHLGLQLIYIFIIT